MLLQRAMEDAGHLLAAPLHAESRHAHLLSKASRISANASPSAEGQLRSSSSTTSAPASARRACDGACAIPTRAGRSLRTRSASCRSRPTSKTVRCAVARLACIVLHLPLVISDDVDQIAHLVQPGVDARPHPLLQVLG